MDTAATLLREDVRLGGSGVWQKSKLRKRKGREERSHSSLCLWLRKPFGACIQEFVIGHCIRSNMQPRFSSTLSIADFQPWLLLLFYFNTSFWKHRPSARSHTLNFIALVLVPSTTLNHTIPEKCSVPHMATPILKVLVLVPSIPHNHKILE